ncbi:MAG: hypothetical protein CM15mP84_07140 [Cellvibrionales bacterium]|nr:MAG: hypothetical protein CM15mP84_07140 [Cellvibrionales bacterium]
MWAALFGGGNDTNLTKKPGTRGKDWAKPRDPATGLAIGSGMTAASQRATASVIAATEIAGAMDVGESLRIVNHQLASSPRAGSNPVWSRARTLSNPSALAAGEAGAAAAAQ